MSDEHKNCTYCGARLVIVHVHGHGQCSHCGTNVEPCCSGASPEDAEGAVEWAEVAADPKLFERVFTHLGGSRASVSRESLCFALGQWLGLGMEEALVVLDAGVHTGKLLTAGPDTYRLPHAA